MAQTIAEIQKIALNCVLSFWFFYSSFCFSKDVNDRKTPHKKVPTWKYLKKFQEILEKYQRVCILKTRQMFFSTFLVIYILWVLLFSDKPQQIFIMSELLKKAYDKTGASLYGRLMYAYTHLPSFLKTTLEPSFQPEVVLKSKVTGTTITFSATTPTAGRGSSYDWVIVDEYAWHEQHVAKDLISSLVPMCYRLTVLSSPRGRNHFWKLIKDIQSGEIEGFYFWDATKEEIDPEDVQRREIYNQLIKATPLSLRAREFSGSFDETQEGKTFPDFNYFDAKLDKMPSKDFIFKYPRIGGMDFGIGDPTSIVLCNNVDGELHKFFSYEANNCLPEAFVGQCVEKLMIQYSHEGLTELEAKQLLSETVIYGDASGNNRSQTHDTTLIKEYKKFGLLNLKLSIRSSIKDGILAIHQIISQNNFKEFIGSGFEDTAVITHIAACHYPVSNAGVILTVDKYDHDSLAFSSHIMDCVRYMCLNFLRKGSLQGFEIGQEQEDLKRKENIAKHINPIFLGKVKDFNGNVIQRGRGDGTNLT